MGPAEEWAGLLAGVVVGALFGVLSSALGLLTRSTAFALTALLLWKFVLEGIVPVVTHRPELAHWTPANVAIAFVDPSKPWLTTSPSGVLMLMYVAVFAVAAAATFIRRDP
jgi:hypothetical protein